MIGTHPKAGTIDIEKCRTCRHVGWDPDGHYCGHPKSFAETMFGRGLPYMRKEDGPCGPSAQLFEEETNVDTNQ